MQDDTLLNWIGRAPAAAIWQDIDDDSLTLLACNRGLNLTSANCFISPLFHLSTNVRDLDESRRFYSEVLGCREGRSTDSWVDFDFFGHQLSLHKGAPTPTSRTGMVDEVAVPMPHFGVILNLERWQGVAQKLIDSGVEFLIPPTTRFAGEAGEQATMFFADPSGNWIEMKGFATAEGVLAA
jgi:uncharacterized protein